MTQTSLNSFYMRCFLCVAKFEITMNLEFVKFVWRMQFRQIHWYVDSLQIIISVFKSVSLKIFENIENIVQRLWAIPFFLKYSIGISPHFCFTNNTFHTHQISISISFFFSYHQSNNPFNFQLDLFQSTISRLF